MYTPKPIPGTITSPELVALANWVQDELQAIAREGSETQTLELRPSAAEPQFPREGMVVYADGTNWNPGNGAGTYQYVGGVWVLQRSGAEPNSYGTISDGTNTAPANSAGATFKLRADVGLALLVTNNDVTHGDNAIYSLDLHGLTSTTPALGDEIPFADVSASNAPKRATPQTIFDLFGALTTDSSPDPAADYIPSYDASAGVAKKVLLDLLTSWSKISTTAVTSGTSVDITLPSGYKHLLLLVHDISASSAYAISQGYSDDNGSTIRAAWEHIFNDASHQQGSVGVGTPIAFTNAGVNASDSVDGFVLLFDYAGSKGKMALTGSLTSNATPVCLLGLMRINTTNALNLVRFSTSAGNFDGSGSIEVWGTR